MIIKIGSGEIKGKVEYLQGISTEGAVVDFLQTFLAGPAFLFEGAIGTRISSEYGLTADPVIALAGHAYTEPGRRALGEIYSQYHGTADRAGLPFLAVTPTRRVNAERGPNSPFGERAIPDMVGLLRSVAVEGATPLYVGGTMGCKGNAYTGEGMLGEEEARRFHGWAASRFAEAGADFIFASIMPALPEAIGLARACCDYGMPYIISFMLRGEGRLPDGTGLHEAIAGIEAAAAMGPVCYMCNCVHPAILGRALGREFNRTDLVRGRFLGIQANAANLEPEELDGIEGVRNSPPGELAWEVGALRDVMNLRIAGGCCGTDNASLAAIAAVLTSHQGAPSDPDKHCV